MVEDGGLCLSSSIREHVGRIMIMICPASEVLQYKVMAGIECKVLSLGSYIRKYSAKLRMSCSASRTTPSQYMG